MNIIKSSLVFQFVNLIIDRVEKVIKNSGIYRVLTKERKNPASFSLLEEILYKIIAFIRKIFKVLKLDRVFKDSIFAKTYIWVGITIAFTPILSTKQILLLVACSILSFVIKICIEPEIKFIYTPLNAWIVVFIGIYAFCGIISLDMASSIKIAMLIISFILFYFVIINSVTTKQQLKTILGIFIVIGALVSVYGIYQYLFAGSFASSSFVDKELFENIKTRVNGTFDNPNVLGEYLLFIIPIIASAFFAERGVIKKTICCLLGAVCIACLALTYSRGCYLGLVLSMALFVLLISFRWIIAFCAGIMVFPIFLPESIMNRFTSIGNIADSSTSYRISIWKGVIDMLGDYWYRPIGQGTIAFNSIYPLYSYSGVGAQHSHNLFLQLMIETGIVGIVVFIGILFKFFQNILSGIVSAKNKIYKLYMIGFTSGMVGFLIQSLFDNTWYNNKIILIFWTFIGLATLTKSMSEKEATDEKN